MTYQYKDLSVLAYANGFTLWHYTTMDTAADVNGTGYFNPASDMVRVGDMIMANVDTGGTPASGIFLVNANAGGTVDVADMTPAPPEVRPQQEAGNHIPSEKPRYELRYGKYGTCFHDTGRGGPEGVDMPLDTVLENLNRLEAYTQRLAKTNAHRKPGTGF